MNAVAAVTAVAPADAVIVDAAAGVVVGSGHYNRMKGP